jgi:hypothetical protein
VLIEESQSVAKKLAKNALVLAIAGTAVYAALRPEEVARQAIAATIESHKALAQRVEVLQRWAEASKTTAEEAKASCAAKASALIAFTQGYLLALSNAGNAPRGRQPAGGAADTPEEIKALMRALGGSVAHKQAEKLPALVPPPAPPQQAE